MMEKLHINRVGKNGKETSHAGNSMVAGPTEEIFAIGEEEKNAFVQATLFPDTQIDYRSSYPFAGDWDQFIIKD